MSVADERRTRVLIVTGDLIGEKMAGPAIRVWNMAEALADACDVRVVSWNRIERTSERFGLHAVHESDDAAIAVHEQWCDVIVVQGVSFRMFPSVRTSAKIVVADLYDPFQLEQLELNKFSDERTWNEEVRKAVSLINEQLLRADAVLCASERQRDLWLGALSTLGRLNPSTYRADETFSSFVRIVPFGLPVAPPVRTRPALKGIVPGIDDGDVVLIWGGGIYNWFDPVSLIEAMGVLRDSHPHVKLFFLSASHFNPDVPEMQVVADTVGAAERLGLRDRTVFFNDSWVDYDDRVNYLLDADIGVSTHVVHAETRFSFRTRLLDYLWAGLPIIATEGDTFADVITSQGLGAVVPEKDAAALAAAIATLAEPGARAAAAARVRAAAASYTWPQALSPLVDFCTAPVHAADHGTRPAGLTGGDRFERILAMPRGRRRDLALLRYYLTSGGFRLVREKVAERRERLGRNV
jgi:glycosyltransferase involved in cell wall biosynthesis